MTWSITLTLNMISLFGYHLFYLLSCHTTGYGKRQVFLRSEIHNDQHEISDQ